MRAGDEARAGRRKLSAEVGERVDLAVDGPGMTMRLSRMGHPPFGVAVTGLVAAGSVGEKAGAVVRSAMLHGGFVLAIMGIYA